MKVRRLGRLPYEAALAAQHAARDRVSAGDPDQLLLLEHDPVVTMGRRGGLVDRAALARLNTPVVDADRGGLATWHGPGQLVGYAIIDLTRLGMSVPRLVSAVGSLMRRTAEAFGVDARYDPDRPGLYATGGKLGSIGLHIRRGVTTHGFALNVDIDFAGFAAIEPCGLTDLAVTSLARELGRAVRFDDALDVADGLAGPGPRSWGIEHGANGSAGSPRQAAR